MLHVWSASGEELVSMSMEELSDVGRLKQHLRKRWGFPVCVQRLLHDGTSLDDHEKLDVLDSAVDVQLVLLPVSSFTAEKEQLADELTIAAAQGHLETVRSLLEANVDKDVLDTQGATALTHAADQGHVETLRFLLESRADKDLADMFGNTALIRASQHSHVETATLLLQAGADKDRVNTAGVTALSLAADRGRVEIVHLLLEAGADKNLATRFGDTALTRACGKGHIEVVRLLLARANLDAMYRTTRAALARAADNGHVETVRLLLDARADKNLPDGYGATALSRAAEKGHQEIVGLLSKYDSTDSFASCNTDLDSIAISFPATPR